MKRLNLTYQSNGKEYGIDYDYAAIKKAFRSLKIPKGYWTPNIDAMKGNAYSVILSERSRAKTTNVLLLGLVFNALYGTQICYLRETKEESVKDVVCDMVNVINDPSYRYIERLTDGDWDTITYRHHSKRFYYAKYKVGEDGKKTDQIDTIAETPCIIVMTVENAPNYKSGFNNPLADFVVFDECTKRRDRPDTFLDLMDLLATIRRDRTSMRVFMLSNTIAPNSQIYSEMMISKVVRSMRKGQWVDHVTEKGTHIHIEMLTDQSADENRQHGLMAFFGFDNPRLSSITGADEWALDYYKHIPHEAEYETLEVLFIQINAYQMARCTIVIYNGHVCLFVTPFENPRPGSLILTMDEDALDNTHHYACGSRKILKIFETCIKLKYCYYATNEIGCDFENYVYKSREIMGSIIL